MKQNMAWMDEGWATMGEWLLSPMIDSTIDPDDYGMDAYDYECQVRF